MRTLRSLDTVMLGDCTALMGRLETANIDFVLTDPPYITRYRARDGRTVINDDNDRWLKPAFAEIFRLLKAGSFCVSFYGWNQADRFIAAWRVAGFQLAGHMVFSKSYASSIGFMRFSMNKPICWPRVIRRVRPRRLGMCCRFHTAATGCIRPRSRWQSSNRS